ncbi:hypothetical protein CVT25_001172 [Psilocybe cyanescens]|uniref:Uncharacterized protein n=1 Tax=Psilocybe cyanescens TaxID=93625 RepID=A0A409XMD8_PSICY|nr:hypothetical protein CVT25_001172 [Psilocybe cyanescens]
MRKPDELREDEGKWFLEDLKTPLTDSKLNEHESKINAYEQKQAQVHEAIYKTVSKSAFLEIKGEATAAAM